MSKLSAQGEVIPFQHPLIERVRIGMPVVDVTGEVLGRVSYIQMGDPEADTVSRLVAEKPSYLGPVKNVFSDEPELPEPFHRQLLRVGFIKVDGPGFFHHTHRYVRADQIADVAAGQVRLTLPKERILVNE